MLGGIIKQFIFQNFVSSFLNSNKDILDHFLSFALFHFLAGNGLIILAAELKSQKRIVRNLKKKSLWSRSLEEVLF